MKTDFGSVGWNGLCGYIVDPPGSCGGMISVPNTNPYAPPMVPMPWTPSDDYNYDPSEYERIRRWQEQLASMQAIQEMKAKCIRYLIMVDPEQEDLSRAYMVVTESRGFGGVHMVKSGLSLEEAKEVRIARMVADKLCETR